MLPLLLIRLSSAAAPPTIDGVVVTAQACAPPSIGNESCGGPVVTSEACATASIFSETCE